MSTIGQHVVTLRETVRDPSHYRIDIQTAAPALDAGVLIVTENGHKLLAYDSRMNIAAWTILKRPVDVSEVELSLQPMVTQPDPNQSLAEYLHTLRANASGAGSYTRTVGHAHLLGRPVDVVEFGPLIGVAPPGRPGVVQPPCRSRCPGIGGARLWVTSTHPTLLRETEDKLGPLGRKQYSYQVTSLQYGAVPSSALRYTPPVHAARSEPARAPWVQVAVVGGGDSGWFGFWPQPARVGEFYQAAPPAPLKGKAFAFNSVNLRRDSVYPRTSAIGILYYQPTRTNGLPPSQYPRHGPYVYLQERIQVHGLPTALKTGHTVHVHRCTFWIGAFPHKQPWLALAHGRLSLLVSSNVLTPKDLQHYATQHLCL